MAHLPAARAPRQPRARGLHPIANACVLLLIGSSAAQAQEAPTPQTLDTVVVTGIRKGVEDAIATKRNNTSIVEAISSEDIGKLPDVTVAESLGRVSGIAVQRSKVNGKAAGVSVRGMAPAFGGSLFNGREVASTSDARSPEFDLFPAELLSSILIYKTPDASLVGQGLSATVDMRTIRPLDHGKRTIAANARRERIGVDSGVEVGEGNRYSLVYVDQFANRTLGVAVALSSLREDNGGEHRFDSWGGWAPQIDHNGQQVTVPGGFKYETQRRQSTRDGAVVTLQYKPNIEFKTTADIFYGAGTEKTKQTGLEGAIAFGAGIYDPNGQLSNATISGGVATSGTINNYKGVVRNHMFSNKDRLLSLGLNSELRTGDWRWEVDAAHSRGEKNISNFETTAGQPGNVPQSSLATISWTGFNGSNFADVKYTTSGNFADRNFALLTDVDGWGGGPATPQAGYAALPTIADKVTSLRFTAHNDLEWGPIVGSRFGINLNKRDKSRLGDEGRLSVLNGSDGYAGVKMPGEGTALAGASGISVASWDPTGSLGSIYALNRWVDATVLSRNWTVGEKVATAYAVADVAGDLAGLPYTGNIGVQLVHTSQTASGNQVDLAKCTGITVETCPYVVRTDGTSYNHLLPSLNLTFDLGSQQLLRIGAGKQVARANLDNMKASLDFSVQTATALQPALTGFAGNPRLKPYAAKALDVSYEKYFGKHGYVALAGFFKKLDNYVINSPRQFDFKPYTSPTTPLPATGPYAGSTVGFLTQPVNGNGGNMHGFEFTLNLPGSMLHRWLDGFGTQVSHSYTDSSIRLPTAGFVSPQNGPVFRDSVAEIGLPGLSKNVTTLRLYYERAGFQLAWAAHKRSDFIGQILDYRSDSQFTFIKGETIVGAQVGYEFQSGWLKGLSVLLQGHNMTNEPFQEYTTDRNIVTNKVVYGKTYRLGLNYKY
ncbi:TonB-dependent receptor [Roseateles asaccharophilus]|uniref:Iron complex outermembrane receptor protein n=1 Tax=Roseateles asaccharophilus TaxID=582607 RepID=A0ABU2A6W5_9BURK|nr:TonB-dependent receptor [Roseateles asaccharophilus]MDR7332919.1 iron complex outermembrane receptor protein [Roseateles asaccharophilus]